MVTDEGKRLVAAGHEIADRVHAEVLAELPPASRGVFADSLTQLVSGLLAEPVAAGRFGATGRPFGDARLSPGSAARLASKLDPKEIVC